MSDIFADLENEADFAPRPARGFEAPLARDPAPLNKERCRKCGGSGRFGTYRTLGACFACKGTGWLTFKTDSATRAKATEARHARKERTASDWREAHPAVVAWIDAKAERFPFARAMRDALAQYGSLTERQLATCERLAKADEERAQVWAQERVEKAATAPAVNVSRIADAMNAARASGIKRPLLRLADFKFSFAPATGRNPGAIYIKDTGGEYLGKVADGRLLTSRTGEASSAAILAACADPEAAAIAYGRRFGQCACCGRELSNAASIARGIGPICADKFGW